LSTSSQYRANASAPAAVASSAIAGFSTGTSGDTVAVTDGAGVAATLGTALVGATGASVPGPADDGASEHPDTRTTAARPARTSFTRGAY